MTTDADLRALERRAHAEHDPHDEDAVLVARLRAGATTPARLALAAWLGDPLARDVLGPDAPAPRTSPVDESVPPSALPLDEDARRVLVRAMAADLRQSPSWPEDPLGLQMLEQAERWADGGPTPPSVTQLHGLMEALVAQQQYDQAAWLRDALCIIRASGADFDAARPASFPPDPSVRALDLLAGAGASGSPPAMFRRVGATSLYRRARLTVIAWTLGGPNPRAAGRART